MANAVLEKAIDKEATAAGWAAPTKAAPTWTEPGPGSGGAVPYEDRMTIGGVVSATGVLFVLLLASGAYGWSLIDPAPEGQATFPGWILIPILAGFGLVLLASFKPQLARFLGPLYALVQGVVLGAISRVYENEWDGIVIQAVLITAFIFLAVLFVYSVRIIRVTERIRRVVIAATMGIALFYLASLLLSIFGAEMPLIWDAGPFGILFSVAVAGLAAFNLLLDFDLAERGVEMGLPKHMEWFCALGLMVSIVWLYLEILRLLAKLRR